MPVDLGSYEIAGNYPMKDLWSSLSAAARPRASSTSGETGSAAGAGQGASGGGDGQGQDGRAGGGSRRARALQPDDADDDAGQPNGQNQQSSSRGNRGGARGRGGRLWAGALRNPSAVETGGGGEMNGENGEGWKVPITCASLLCLPLY